MKLFTIVSDEFGWDIYEQGRAPANKEIVSENLTMSEVEEEMLFAPIAPAPPRIF